MITHLATPQELAGEEVTVAGEPYRHLFRARRLAVGARLRVVDGDGGARWATVAKVERRQATLHLGDSAPTNEAAYHLHLVVASPRPERAAWLVEKATELGVAAIDFVHTERAPRRYGPAIRERFQRVATAALEQCHRARLPVLEVNAPWQRVETLLAAGGDRWFLDTAAATADGLVPSAAGGVVVVGPEGGWSDEERTALNDAGAAGIGLGPRVLRVETAALAAASRLLLAAGPVLRSK